MDLTGGAELSEPDDRFYVKDSTVPGAGRGCFARVALRAGDCLEVVGVLVQPGSAADRCTAYADHYKFRHAGQLLLPVGFAALVNHSATPNLEKHERDGRLFLRAVRDVAAGEELFFTYSTFAQQMMGLNG
jgi:SET domain-containing protein